MLGRDRPNHFEPTLAHPFSVAELGPFSWAGLGHIYLFIIIYIIIFLLKKQTKKSKKIQKSFPKNLILSNVFLPILHISSCIFTL